MKHKEQYLGEIRYAIRLTQRTARLYRRIQTAGIFLLVLGGSAAMAYLSSTFPTWLITIGGTFLAVASAMLLAIRPADKAAQNEADVKKYQTLMSRAVSMSVDELEKAIEDARNGDAPEIESLREVAFNDVALESNRPDVVVPLNITQKILRSLA